MNPIRIVTHAHTKYSSGPASALNDYVRNSIHQVLGFLPEDFEWTESATEVHQLIKLLNDRVLDLLFITDHINERHHEYPEALYDLAASHGRLGVGAEIQTYLHDPEQGGEIRMAPEILVYGPPEGNQRGARTYWGVTNEFLREMFATCQVDPDDPENKRIDLFKAQAFCKDQGVVHGISHPFDSHKLALPTTLKVVSRFKIVEALNGGYPKSSAAALTRYIELHNLCLLRSQVQRQLASQGNPLQREILDHMAGGDSIALWSGADAHISGYDRVVMEFDNPRGRAHFGDFLEYVDGCSGERINNERRIRHRGRAMSAIACASDVFSIFFMNGYANRKYFASPKSLGRFLTRGQKFVSDELWSRRKARQYFQKQLFDDFDLAGMHLAAHAIAGEEPRWKLAEVVE